MSNPYTITRQQATDYLIQQFECVTTAANSSNPIIRHLSRNAIPIVETVMQYLDTLEGSVPYAMIIALLGDVVIVDDNDLTKVIVNCSEVKY